MEGGGAYEDSLFYERFHSTPLCTVGGGEGWGHLNGNLKKGRESCQGGLFYIRDSIPLFWAQWWWVRTLNQNGNFKKRGWGGGWRIKVVSFFRGSTSTLLGMVGTYKWKFKKQGGSYQGGLFHQRFYSILCGHIAGLLTSPATATW